jgi:hypothetical protein
MDLSEHLETLLKQLIFLNSIIATEVIQITENTSALLREGKVPPKCIEAHDKLRKDIIRILEETSPELVKNLREHLFGH